MSNDLWAAGRWARACPPDCVDYLVGNEYTAYWLHLAVLGNSRASRSRSDTFLTEPSFGRWLVPGQPALTSSNASARPPWSHGEAKLGARTIYSRVKAYALRPLAACDSATDRNAVAAWEIDPPLR